MYMLAVELAREAANQEDYCVWAADAGMCESAENVARRLLDSNGRWWEAGTRAAGHR